jgi:hypothetical protein
LINRFIGCENETFVREREREEEEELRRRRRRRRRRKEFLG